MEQNSWKQEGRWRSFVSTATKTVTSEQLENALTEPYSGLVKELEEQEEAVSKHLTDDEQKLLDELLSIFDEVKARLITLPRWKQFVSKPRNVKFDVLEKSSKAFSWMLILMHYRTVKHS